MPAPEQSILIYDGHCSFCTSQAESLKRQAHGRVAIESFQDPAVLKKYPALTHADCMKEVKLVKPDGKILGGAHAILYALAENPVWKFLLWLYPLPILKTCFDLGYQFIANRRYWIKRKKKDCPGGNCNLHQ